MDIFKKQKIITVIAFLIILLFLLFIGSGEVISPFFGDINMLDEGEYGGWMMHLFAGGHLYKDVYAAYGPLYIYPVYILAKIFSPTVFLIRIVYIVINTFFAILIIKLIVQEIKIPYYLQLICIALLLIIPGIAMRQGMGFLSFFLLYKAVRNKKLFWSFLTGGSLALTFLTSSDIGIFSALISIFYLFYNAILFADGKEFFKKTISLICSYLFIFLLFFTWSMHEGWFYAYITTIGSDLSIYSNITIPIGKNFPDAFILMPHSFSVIKWIKYIISQQMLLYWLYFLYIVTFVYFFIRIVLRKFKSSEDLVLLTSLFGFLLSTILVGRVDHLNFTLPPAIVLLVYYLSILISITKAKKEKTDKLVSLFLIVIITLFSVRLISIYRPHFSNILNIPYAIATNRNTISYLGPVVISKQQASAIQTLQAFIKTHITKNDKVYVFSNEPMLYLFLDKNDPTRYDLPEVANVKDKRMEVLKALQMQKPKYIIYGINSYAVDDVSNYTRLPEVSKYIKKNYVKGKIGEYIIYRIKK